MSQCNLNEEFYYPVQKLSDTETQSISADVVSRVLRCASDYLHSRSACDVMRILSAWLSEADERTPGGE